MLNREKAPLKGLWNGVGGKIEAGETPLEGAIREIKEETGIEVGEGQIQYKGIVTWELESRKTGGMHAFLVNMPENFFYSTPKKTDEGILDWKKVSWLLNEDNNGVGKNIPFFLPKVLNDPRQYLHKCIYADEKVVEYAFEELNILIKKG